MADTPGPIPVPPALPVEDPFDIGDTSLTFPQSVATSASLPEETPAAKVSQPRAADGTFAKPEPTHPAFLVSQAVDFGLEAEDINSLTTPALYKVVNRMMAKEREISRSFATQQSLEGARVPQPAPTVPPAPPVPDEFEQLANEGLNPLLVAEIRKLREAKKDVDALKLTLQERDVREQTEKVSIGAQLVDAAFLRLDNPLLGKESGAELAADPSKTAQFKRRIALLNACGITDLRQVNRQTIMKQLREASELLFGSATPTAADPYAAALNGKPRITEEEWNNAGVARPSQRTGSPELKGEALAVANLTRRFREQESQRTNETDLDGIPD